MRPISGMHLIEIEEGLLKLASKSDDPEAAQILREASHLLSCLGITLWQVRRTIRPLED